MFRNKLDYLILIFMCIMMFISIRYTNSVVDWWDSFVNGREMNIISIIYMFCLIGVVICVFMNYYGKELK